MQWRLGPQRVDSFVTRSLSHKLSCVVPNACGTVSPEMKRTLPYTGEDAQFLAGRLRRPPSAREAYSTGDDRL